MRPIHRIVIVGSLLLLLRLAPAPAGAAGATGATGVAALTDSLNGRIEALRADNAYEQAVVVAGELLDRLRAAGARPWDVGSAQLQLTTLSRIAALPEAARQELAAADALLGELAQHYRRGEFAAAIAVAERQLTTYRRHLGDASELIAKKQGQLAVLHLRQGDYAEAVALSRASLAFYRQVLGEVHPSVATGLNNLAAMLRSQGSYAAAEPLYREALAIYRRTEGERSAKVAAVLNNLAYLDQVQGDYAGAEPLLRESLAMRREVHGESHPAVATALNNLALLLERQGKTAEAEPLFRDALAIRRQALGEEHPDVAQSMHNLAQLLLARGDDAAAEALYREALALQRRRLGASHPDIARSLQNLAYLLLQRDDLAAAEPLYLEALSMRRALLGDEHPDVAESLHGLGQLRHRQGKHRAAEQLFRAALAQERRFASQAHPDRIQTLVDLATCRRELGAGAEAESLLSVAARSFELARLRAGRGLERATFMRSPYPLLAAVRLDLGRAAAAWPALERDLGRALADLLQAAGRRSLAPGEAAREDSLLRALDRQEAAVTAFEEAAARDTSAAARLQTARNRLTFTEAELSRFGQAIAARYPLTEGQAVGLPEVQAAIPAATALVGWLDVEVGLDSTEAWGYAIRRRGPVAWARLARSAAAGSSCQASWKRTLRAAGDAWPDAGAVTGTAAAARPAGDLARRLYRERLAPLAPALAGVTRLVVVPSGPMLGLPVEALAADDGRLVGERYAVSYVPSATIYGWLARRRAQRSATAPRGTALLVGDPPFAGSGTGQRHAQRAVAAGQLRPLPMSRVEVEEVAGFFPHATLLLGADASEQRILELALRDALRDFEVIHLATHALVDDQQPGRSAFVLSQVELPEPLAAAMAGERIVDGLLTAEEIVREWHLDAELVTLSACETALGREAGGEGYVGFAHAFLQAGARSLLVSLWRVEDEPTSLLMRRFYQNRAGAGAGRRGGGAAAPMPEAEALQEAKRWLRGYTDAVGRHPYADPHYWSAFVLIGE